MTSPAGGNGMSYPANHIVVVTPVLDDWQSVMLLLRRLNEILEARRDQIDILLVDDGGRERIPDELLQSPWYTLGTVQILRLRRNLGHQTAIAVGLCYVEQHMECDAVLIMDGDGEDSPSDALRLVDAVRLQSPPQIVFAERTYRSEGLLFRLGYATYRLAHRLLTGRRIRFGNFSIIPAEFLSALVVIPELWVHYAAAVLRSRLPYQSIPTRRSRRLAGESKMNLTSLTLHAIRAFSVCSDVVGARVLLFSLICLIGCTSLIAAAGTVHFGTNATLPTWTFPVGALMVLLTFQLVGLAAQFALYVAGSAASAQILPSRDSAAFIKAIHLCTDGRTALNVERALAAAHESEEAHV